MSASSEALRETKTSHQVTLTCWSIWRRMLNLLDLAGLNVELERLLGHAVDVVPARMLKPRAASSALAHAVAL